MTAAAPPLVHRAFAAQVERAPEAIALAWQGGRLSYRELGACAGRLARRLRARGLGPEDIVGVLLERSPDAVAALLGVLEAGAAYLPLDPAFPRERLAWMLADAGARALVTREPLARGLPSPPAPIWLGAPEDGETNGVPPLAVESGPQSLAYLIYTSGSTGRPKGVLVPHGALAHHGAAVREHYGLAPGDRVLQFASFGFDVAAEELFATLASGATLVLRPDPLPDSFRGFHRFVEQERLTVLNLPASYWHGWVDDLERSGERLPPGLRLVVAGSEPVLPGRLAAWRRLAGRGVRWLNAYGPTEATITATLHEPPPDAELGGSAAVPIGHPLAPVRARVLDPELRPVPGESDGELCLGGPTLARGYLGHPDRTAERFVPDPFASEPGARLYRTGDSVRRRPDGELEFLGRLDDQVKVRGFRIEPGEVEAALLEHPAVERAVVVAREVAPGDRRLAAYTVGGASARGLRAFLRERLPEPYVPAWIVPVDALPLLPNGKVDRRALPAPAADGGEEYVAPATPTEEALAALFAELLGVPRVGAGDDFFALGGHSLLATALAARVREAFGVELSLRGLLGAPTVAAVAAAVDGAARAGAAPELPPIRRLPRPGPFPLSFPQERVWFLGRLAPASIAYNTQLAVLLDGPLDLPALSAALAALVRRHEVFRTSFEVLDGRPVQWVHPAAPAPLPVVDLSGLPAARREAEAAALSRREFQWRFDVAHPPLVRWTLLRLAPEEHRLLQVEHHFVHDGWSLSVLFRDLRALYRAAAAGRPPGADLPELPVQFADFAAWQREWMQGEVLAAEVAWWRERLAGMPAPLELPPDRPRPRAQSFRGEGRTLPLPAPLFAALRDLGRSHGATPFMVLLAAFEALLLHYTGREDVVIGSSVANRRLRESEGLIGMIVNNLVLRTDLGGDPPFAELLDRVRETTLAAHAHQDVPFEKLVQALQPERDLSRNPLFQIAFSFHDSAMPELDLGGGLRGRIEYTYNDSAKFDLNIVLVPPAAAGEEAQVLWEHATDLYDAATVLRLHRHFRALLEAVAAAPRARLGALPLLDAAERQQLLREWNDTEVDFGVEPVLHRLIEAQVERTPGAPAVVFEGEALTYRELDERANRLAHELRRLGVGPEVPVGLCAERSLELVVGLLGILKAGGAYVPLDPHYPRERLTYMLEDALAGRAAVVLTQARLAGLFSAAGARRVLLDADGPAIAARPATPPAVASDPDQLAYVIYTSGSTGRPKGAMNTHRAIVNRLLWMQAAYGLTAADRVLQKTPASFDVSVWEFFWPLLAGARLVLARPGGHQDAAYLARTIAEEGITTVHFVPSLLRAFLEQPGVERCTALRRVFASGEALARDLEERFFARLACALHNLYGPTEAAVDVTFHACRAERERPAVPIGRPVANTAIHVLGRDLRPAPIGVAGELCIGGVQLARGYLRRPELTAERFVPDPCASAPGARLYRTGDLARRLPDGEVEFLGRLDHQVKLRGFRVEPGEIAAALAAHPAVREAAVLLREDVPGDPRLVAYVAAEGEVATEELVELCRRRLPEHMVPWAFVPLPALPLTPNGKLDRAALPAPAATPAAGSVPPRGPVEEVVAELFCRTLGIERIGVHDGFFALGGHSLTATTLLIQLGQAFGLELPLLDFFARPTVAGVVGALLAREERPGRCEVVARLLQRLAAVPAEQVAAMLREERAARAEAAP